MPKRSLWENLGRAVHYGVEKAKEIGDHLADQAEERLDVRDAERRLAESHRALGKWVAERAEASEAIAGPELEAHLLQVRECLEGLRKAEEEVARKQAEEEAAKARAAQEASADETGESPPPGSSTATDTTSGETAGADERKTATSESSPDAGASGSASAPPRDRRDPE